MRKLEITLEERTYEIAVDWHVPQNQQVTITLNGKTMQVTLPEPDAPFRDIEWMIVDGRPYEITFDHDLHWLQAYSGIHALDIRDLDALVTRPRSGDARIKAPIPGLIAHVLVDVGQRVEVGEAVVVLEAMKMENEIQAAATGTVTAVHVQPGQSVLRNDVLVEVR